jgi:subtilisin family serine protease
MSLMRVSLIGVLVLLALAGSASAAPIRVGVIDSGLGPNDPTGHGTAVAEVLRESATARRAQVRVVSLPDANLVGIGQPRLMAQAIRRAGALHIRVVNISQTIPGRAGRVRRAFAASPDTLFVVAAGNEGLDLAEPGLERDPCSAPQRNVVCVGELGPGGHPAASSNFGAGVVDAWAPGPGGTSFAAPRVAAHAAALLSRHPTWSVAQVRASLLVSSQ